MVLHLLVRFLSGTWGTKYFVFDRSSCQATASQVKQQVFSYIIESVDSISRDGPVHAHICNTKQKVKNLSPDKILSSIYMYLMFS